MLYILNLFNDEKRFASLSEEEAKARMGAYVAYREALREAGAWAGGERLRPVAESTQVRVGTDGRTSVLDGPYADTKEQLAGYFLIDVPDLDAAISWAARCPAASEGTVEIRPIWPAPVRA
ncbi:MAG TPA: YciI family protein [Candidatus Acidoferrales bacterium]|nr:YciI family protein [Candidatus Acidoferrales bacterium]